ncbi:HipA domain-containing protein [Phnomibacter ginsenosidimutans]|nr:HipA domain-containing protein [Phnomibacter ginsenosidimutans]
MAMHPSNLSRLTFFEPDSVVRKSSSKSWHSFIAKTAEKWYPHESVIEYMINRIGQVLDPKMNEIKLVQANGQIRFCSKFFLNRDERLIHGAEICGEHLGDLTMAEEIANNKKTSRELFTFEFIRDSIRTVFPENFEALTTELVKMIAFDALVGNNDRHFYNWGVIGTMKKSKKLPTFAPLYDSARGLFWNYSDENLKNLLKAGQKKVLSYIENASPRISIEDNSKANHFELVDFVGRLNHEYDQIVKSMSSLENELKVLEMLEKEFFPMFIQARKSLIKEVIQTRFKKIRGY